MRALPQLIRLKEELHLEPPVRQKTVDLALDKLLNGALKEYDRNKLSQFAIRPSCL